MASGFDSIARAQAGGSQLHGGMVAARRSLRIFRQSRRPPCPGGV